jgi:endonuclease YncB( thermonuclease family)
MNHPRPISLGALHGLVVMLLIVAAAPAVETESAQPRTHGTRVPVPIDKIRIDDGDTLTILWRRGDVETVRILGIDTPETRHEEHGIPFDQPFGRQAAAFGQGVLAVADKVELVRASTLDPYGRTLGYLYVNDRNYSVLLLSARLAVETVSHFGDNGLPREAKACLDAAAKAGPVPFEPPYVFRKRMREFSGDGRSE